MRQPKRVEYYQVGSDGMVRNHDIDYSRGHGSLYVAACDYAALAAENDRLRKHLNDLNLWSQEVRYAFQMNEDTPPSIGYMLDYSMKNNVPFHMPPMTWSFSKETVHILFQGLNEIESRHSGPETPPAH